MKGKFEQCIEVGNKLYYIINPNTRSDVPSYFYERLEKEYDKWIISSNSISFYDFCLNQIK